MADQNHTHAEKLVNFLLCGVGVGLLRGSVLQGFLGNRIACDGIRHVDAKTGRGDEREVQGPRERVALGPQGKAGLHMGSRLMFRPMIDALQVRERDVFQASDLSKSKMRGSMTVPTQRDEPP